MNHHPTLLASRQGCWATCMCGWKSAIYTSISGAHVAFGRHLSESLRAQHPEPCELFTRKAGKCTCLAVEEASE